MSLRNMVYVLLLSCAVLVGLCAAGWLVYRAAQEYSALDDVYLIVPAVRSIRA